MTAPKDLKTLLAMRNGVLEGDYNHFHPKWTDGKEYGFLSSDHAIVAKSKAHIARGFFEQPSDLSRERLTQFRKLTLAYN